MHAFIIVFRVFGNEKEKTNVKNQHQIYYIVLKRLTFRLACVFQSDKCQINEHGLFRLVEWMNGASIKWDYIKMT